MWSLPGELKKGGGGLLCGDRQILFFLSCVELFHIGPHTLGQVSNLPAKSRCVYVNMMPLFILSIEHIVVSVSLCIVSDPLCLLHAKAVIFHCFTSLAGYLCFSYFISQHWISQPAAILYFCLLHFHAEI